MSSRRSDSAAGSPAAPPGGPSPRAAVRRELRRALVDLALGPPRAAGYLLRAQAARDEVRELLQEPSPLASTAVDADLASGLGRAGLTSRPLRVFVSCAEASGELHALSFVRALRTRLASLGLPAPELFGLGGPALANEGVELVGDPVSRAAMGFGGVTSALPWYLQLLRDAASTLQAGVDVCVPVDSPALHVPLMHLAQRYGVRTAHFVTPQYWGWAPWRAGGYRRAADLALSILPWEPRWFERRGVRCAHVGHPLLDHLADVPVTRPADSGPIALLPGSRAGVVERNLPWMLAVLDRLRARDPALEVVLIQEGTGQEETVQRCLAEAGSPPRDWLRVARTDLHGELTAARAAFSVSGTVLLDLLHHRLPSVVVYRLANGRELWAADHFLTTPWFGSLNLLAGREIAPEFHFYGEGPQEAVCAALERCYKEAPWRAQNIEELDRVAERLGGPGACERAARHVLELVAEGRTGE